MIYIKYISTKSMQKVKIEMRAELTLKEPSITYSGHIIKSTVVASLRNKIRLHIIDYGQITWYDIYNLVKIKKKVIIFFFELLPFANLVIENLSSRYLEKYCS